MLQFFLSSSLPLQLPSIDPPCPHCTRHRVSVIPTLPSRLQIQNNTLEFIDVQNPGASRHIQMSACLFQVRDVLWPQKSKDCYDPVPSNKQVQTQDIVGLTVIFPLLIAFFFFPHCWHFFSGRYCLQEFCLMSCMYFSAGETCYIHVIRLFIQNVTSAIHFTDCDCSIHTMDRKKKKLRKIIQSGGSRMNLS